MVRGASVCQFQAVSVTKLPCMYKSEISLHGSKVDTCVIKKFRLFAQKCIQLLTHEHHVIQQFQSFLEHVKSFLSDCV